MGAVSLGGARFCETHLAQLEAVAASMGRRSKKTTNAVKTRSKTERAAFDDSKARELAQAVRDDVAPSTELWRKISLGYSSAAYKNALEIATESGWVKLLNGKGHVPGDEEPPPAKVKREHVPPRDRRLRAAAAVHAATAPLKRAEVEAAAGLQVKSRSTRYVIAQAIKEGWLARTGESAAVRYVPGTVAPPAT